MTHAADDRGQHTPSPPPPPLPPHTHTGGEKRGKKKEIGRGRGKAVGSENVKNPFFYFSAHGKSRLRSTPSPPLGPGNFLSIYIVFHACKLVQKGFTHANLPKRPPSRKRWSWLKYVKKKKE